jgi:alkanesulfonate monooxygenase SsuD/methylene tetrahydromethanopterin reductase-like flavin-dependent oxidoreductase (luciferase family)
LQYFVSLFPLDRWRSFDELVGVLQVAERLGFARVGLAEHVITPLGLDAPERPSRFWPDNFTFASALARETTRVRFLLSALVVPYRRPLHAAKSIATLDWLSAGRVDVTAGVGWMREEFDALGIPMRERGARTTEYLRAMIELWTSDTPSFDGRYLRFGGLVFEPKCVQRPHVPLLIGGTGERAFAQVLEFGAG